MVVASFIQTAIDWLSQRVPVSCAWQGLPYSLEWLTFVSCSLPIMLVGAFCSKQREKSNPCSEEHYCSLLETVGQITWIASANGELLREQPKWSLFTGQSYKDLKGWGWLDVVHPEDRDRTLSQWQIASTNCTPYKIDHRLQRADGQYCYMRASAVPILESDGRIREWIGFHLDLSDCYPYPDAIAPDIKQLQYIIAQTPIAIAICDNQMRYLLHSKTWLAESGIQRESLVGLKVGEIPSKVEAKWQPLYQRALQGEVLSSPEESWQRPDGTIIHLRWAIQPWYEIDGTVGGLIIVKERIDELVQARETALEIAQAKSRFLANMSHEIRTPMNGVLGMAGLLLHTPLMPKQQDYAKTLYTSTRHLLAIINDILDVSKLEAGEMQLEILDFDLNTCIDEVVDLLVPQAETKALELLTLVFCTVPRKLRGDVVRLRQILLNLLSNAIKFTEVGEVTIQVSQVDETPDRVKLRFCVSDTGIGIPREVQSRLFQAFSQADASTTRRFGGTGLGLAICQQLVELMEGEIGVESFPGQGSTFWFTVTLEKQPETPVSEVTVALAGKRLLIVEPHPMTRQIIQYLAFSWGMRADTVSDRTSAWNAVQKRAEAGNPYDVAILSLVSDEIEEDIELIEKTVANPAIANVSWLLLTTIAQRDRADALKKGLNQQATLVVRSHLLKPVRESQLQKNLEQALLVPEATTDGLECVFFDSTVPSTQEASLKILVAEDNVINQKVILHQLQLLGHEAECVENGQQVLARLEQQEYDLVFMDCQMPVLNGYETTQALRRREANQRRTPVIALTAYAMPSDAEKCLAAGMDDYASKPLDFQQLKAILQRWLNPETQANLSIDASHSISNSDNSPIDWERLQQIARGNSTFISRLLYAFMEAAHTDLLALQTAVTANDYAQVIQVAHRLRGSSANVGIQGMPQQAAQLEKMGRNQNLETASILLDTLSNQLLQAEAALQAWAKCDLA